MNATPSSGKDRAAYISGLRRFADLLEQHPEIPLPWTGTGAGINWHFGDDRAGFEATARLLGADWMPDTTYGDPVQLGRDGWLDGLKVGVTRYTGPQDGPAVTP